MADVKLQEYTEVVRLFDKPDHMTQWLASLAQPLNAEQSQHIRTRDNYLAGCQNSVWISGTETDGEWCFEFDSDSKLTLGVGKILQDVYNGKSAQQIAHINYHDFKPIAQGMTTVKQRGLQIMINRIHQIATNKEHAQ